MISITEDDMIDWLRENHKRVVRPGDHLFVCSWSGAGGCKSFYVKALVDEVIYIWSHPKFEESIWHYAYADGTEQVTIATGELNECGWDKHRQVSREEFDDLRATGELKLANQMPWVDWPIGHAAYLNDDGFLTLEDARRRYGRFSKRKLGRRMRNYIRRVTCFVQGTYKMNGYDPPRYPSVESYMRKGYT